jgi:peptide/nickel transport system permease protein
MIKQFCRHRLGLAALIVLGLFVLVGVYAPLLASSKPLIVRYDGHFYFPLFRYLFFRGFYTKGLDLFYNLAIFTLPLALLTVFLLPRGWKAKTVLILAAFHLVLFSYLMFRAPVDPAGSVPVRATWREEVREMSPYQRLNQVLRFRQRRRQHEKFTAKYSGTLPTLWQADRNHLASEITRQQATLDRLHDHYTSGDPAALDTYERAEAKLAYLSDRDHWLASQQHKISFEIMPLLRPFHWEETAGGRQSLNQQLSWWDLTRINRKDLVASLIFGVRISLVVGLTAVALSLLIGIPFGSLAGYYGGRTDILLSRILEIWEAMPTFFMLLMIVAILQSKSIFLVILVLGIFGWTGFSRFLRAEVLKQRNLAYVDACKSLGFPDRQIMFRHILPNAIPPLLTLLPFSMMAAITSEAGLSFLGLGEDGSTSWGVLMDEGRTAFPAESYLLWPPAIMLTLLLVAIALVGDALRDTLDPKLRT